MSPNTKGFYVYYTARLGPQQEFTGDSHAEGIFQEIRPLSEDHCFSRRNIPRRSPHISGTLDLEPGVWALSRCKDMPDLLRPTSRVCSLGSSMDDGHPLRRPSLWADNLSIVSSVIDV